MEYLEMATFMKRASGMTLTAMIAVCLAAVGACRKGDQSAVVKQDNSPAASRPTTTDDRASSPSPSPSAPAPTPGASPSNSPAHKIEVVETTWASGKPRTREEGYYDDEGNFILHGSVITWYENGQKKTEIYYENNVPHGSRTVWRDDGKLWTQGSYVDGKPHGTWMQWFPDGRPALQLNFDHGKYHGTFIDYHENGVKKKESEWVDGKEISVRVWDETGRELFVVPETEKKSASSGGH